MEMRPLWRGSRCREVVVVESRCGEVVVVERWSL